MRLKRKIILTCFEVLFFVSCVNPHVIKINFQLKAAATAKHENRPLPDNSKFHNMKLDFYL